MLKAEQIPDMCAQEAYRAWFNQGGTWKNVVVAALNAWPGMAYDPGALVTDAYRDPGKIILPLTENGNE